MTSPVPAGQDRPRLQVVSGEAAVLDGQRAPGYRDAGRLGIPARRGRGTARFGGIGQPWLRMHRSPPGTGRSWQRVHTP